MSIQEMYQGPFTIPQTNAIPQLGAIASQLASLQNMYAPSPQQPISVSGDHLIRVKGFESAQQLPRKPNSRDVAFHEPEDIFYIITTDSSNFKTIRTFSFSEIIKEEEKPPQFVTVEEFNRFKEEILNGQQSIRNDSSNASSKSRNWDYGSAGGGKTGDDNVQKNEQSSSGDQ